MKQLREPMIDHAGNVRIGVPVKVLIAGGTTLAALWSNSNGTGALANPINTDTDGLVKAYLADGNYDLVVNPGSPSSFTIYNFQHVDLIGLKAQVLADYAAAVTGAAQAGGAAAAESAVNAARAELQAIIKAAVQYDASNNVGIGRAAAGVKLDVAGTLRSYTAAGVAPVFWLNQTGTAAWTITNPASTNALTIRDEQFSAERLRIDSTGNLLVGVTSGGFHRVVKVQSESGGVLQLDGGTAITALFLACNSGGYNVANAAIQIGKNSSTSRSINAGGTINASGADYAEYMTKAAGCGAIPKGDVCGIDADGKLTDKWADAVRFVVKSTDPNIVGGDKWADHLGARPQQEEDESDDAFALRLEAFEADLEAARHTVDRIAFCGQVPVNFGGSCVPGDYLIPIQIGAGIGVAAVGANVINFAQYRTRLGAVLALREGRPWIDVQHG